MMNFRLLLGALVFCIFTEGLAAEKPQEPLFQHDLAIKRSSGENQKILLLSHDFGRNSQSILDHVKPNTSDTLISFNYIDASILEALRKGKILLDAPFKSIDERISFLGPEEIMLMYKKRALAHKILSPLETLGKLRNLGMTFLLFFDIHDEEQFNQEDSNFAKNLLDANANGTTIIISSDNGGHNATHETLWKIYSGLK